jgi:hypothetical protein
MYDMGLLNIGSSVVEADYLVSFAVIVRQSVHDKIGFSLTLLLSIPNTGIERLI